MSPKGLGGATNVTKGQIQLIKIAQKDLGIEDDDYRSLLLKRFRVSSCTQLTKDQATALIEHFGHVGFELKGGDGSGANRYNKSYESNRTYTPRPPAISRENGKVVRLASPEELAKINALAGLITWDFEDGLSRWMQKRLHIQKVRTAQEAWLAIEGLKKMFSNQMAKACGKDWWDKQFADPKIMRFIKEHGKKETV